MNKIASARTPKIAYNANDTTGGKIRTFISYRMTTALFGQIKGWNLDASGGSEVWNSDNTFSASTGTDPDITYRGDGGKLVVWEVEPKGISSNLISEVISIESAKVPNITTSSGNQRDIYFSWEDRFDYDVDNYKEKAVAIREMYP